MNTVLLCLVGQLADIQQAFQLVLGINTRLLRATGSPVTAAGLAMALADDVQVRFIF